MKRIRKFHALILSLYLMLGLLSNMALAADQPFTDVPDTEWYSDAVQYVYEHGIMNGTSSDMFSPDSPASRGMIVTILHRLEGLPAASGQSMLFVDVPAGEWYTDAVAWASKKGIVFGNESGNFAADDPVTHEQMAVFLYRYAGYKGYDMSNSGSTADFSDGNAVSGYALDAVNWAVGSGLFYGSDGELSPSGDTTRAEAATMLMRLCVRYGSGRISFWISEHKMLIGVVVAAIIIVLTRRIILYPFMKGLFSIIAYYAEEIFEKILTPLYGGICWITWNTLMAVFYLAAAAAGLYGDRIIEKTGTRRENWGKCWPPEYQRERAYLRRERPTLSQNH